MEYDLGLHPHANQKAWKEYREAHEKIYYGCLSVAEHEGLLADPKNRGGDPAFDPDDGKIEVRLIPLRVPAPRTLER